MIAPHPFVWYNKSNTQGDGKMAGNNIVKLEVGQEGKHKRVLSWNKNEPRHKKYTMECVLCGYKTQTSIKSFYNSCKSCSTYKVGSNKNSPEETLWKRYEWKAKQAGQVFEVSSETFARLLHSDCFYCGAEPKQEFVMKRKTDNYLLYNGVDRKENDLGYTESNCVACCWVCNQAKSNIGFDDWKNLVTRWSERVEEW